MQKPTISCDDIACWDFWPVGFTIENDEPFDSMEKVATISLGKKAKARLFESGFIIVNFSYNNTWRHFCTELRTHSCILYNTCTIIKTAEHAYWIIYFRMVYSEFSYEKVSDVMLFIILLFHGILRFTLSFHKGRSLKISLSSHFQKIFNIKSLFEIF